MQTPLTSSSTVGPEVIANCPELGGDIIRIRTGPDDDDDGGFLTALGVPTFAVVSSDGASTPASAQVRQQQFMCKEACCTAQMLAPRALRPVCGLYRVFPSHHGL